MSSSSRQDDHYPLLSVIPPLWIGLGDGLSPFSFSAILIFIVFLGCLGFRRLWLVIGGLCFIATYFSLSLYYVFGLIDIFLTKDGVYYSLLTIHWLVAMSFIFLGVTNFIDWYRYKKDMNTDRFLVTWPLFKCKTTKGRDKAELIERKRRLLSRVTPVIMLIFLSCFVGMVGALLNAFWPQDSYLYFLVSQLMQGNNLGLALAYFFYYALGLILPLLVIWLIILILTHVRLKGIIQRWISMFKVLASAVFLSVGVGLIILLTQ